MAVLQDIKWTNILIDDGNNITEFKKVNTMYGDNHSGKTTLLFIFKALEAGSISDKYTHPEFELRFDDKKGITQNLLTNHILKKHSDNYLTI